MKTDCGCFAEFQRWLACWLRKIMTVPPTPGPLTISSPAKEITVLRYTIGMPSAPQIDDLATREVTINLNNVPTIKPLTPTDTSFQFDVDRNIPVSITLIDVDTSGNRSAPSAALAFTSTDTVPPPQPGGLNVTNVEQV